MDEDLLASLPDEPEMAFGPYENYVRNMLGERQENPNWEFEYVQHIEAFIRQHAFEIPDLPTKGLWDHDSTRYYLEFISAAGVSAKQSFLARASVARTNVSPPYLLSPPEKSKIHHYIDQIRTEIAKANLTPQKRDALSNRLNAFSAEVDRDRTRLDALTAFYMLAKREAKEELKPALETVKRILDVFERASEWLGLPKNDENKKLPSPPKRIEGPRRTIPADDDIPF